ncbi:septum formation initiator [Paradesulfitobacterium ferrireducens]|uniref:septum formation initiator n=1 Tax=Paradesulfitobacterium ferrireducens TaxID=2816476 RepID=UPI001A909098|nr:septum formation initiator [Paradesulfitobacterium ferrireducens]
MIVAQEKIQWQESLENLPRKRKLSPKKKNPHILKWALILVLVTAVAGSIGALTVQLTVAKGAQVRALEKEITGLKVHNDLLQLEVDKLRSVSRIESAALAMGMEKPAGTVYVSGNLPAVKNDSGAQAAQNAADSPPAKTSALKQASRLFTGFFASTQR